MLYIDLPGNKKPSFYLAAEEYFVRNLDISKDYLFLYKNNPCIIIGKHQNPFIEINLKYATEKNFPFYRRISGGGSVFHDPGNLNFCFITKNSYQVYNTYRKFLEPIISFLKKQNINAEINKRNDLILDGKKISGNAQFTSRDRLFCHGTLLLNSTLDDLKETLKPGDYGIESKSTRSVSSSVRNIFEQVLEHEKDTFIADLRQSILEYFENDGTIIPDSSDLSEIKKLQKEKFETWEWNWGRTPFFCFDSKNPKINLNVSVEIDNCHILKVRGLQGSKTPPEFDLLFGERFEKEELQKNIFKKFKSDYAAELLKTIYPFY